MNDMSRYLYVLSAVMVIPFLLGGCRGLDKRSETSLAVKFSQEELKHRLNNFGDHFSLIIQGAADKIQEHATDRQTRRKTVLWKARVIPALKSGLLNQK